MSVINSRRLMDMSDAELLAEIDGICVPLTAASIPWRMEPVDIFDGAPAVPDIYHLYVVLLHEVRVRGEVIAAAIQRDRVRSRRLTAG